MISVGSSMPARAVTAFIGTVVAWVVILGAVAVLTAAVLAPRLGGATPYTVLTGSMQPGMPPGTLVVAKPVDPSAISVGDVITYQLDSGKAAVVTHRVISVGSNLDGQPEFITQGDANNTADAEPVRPIQIRGKRWYSVPKLGHLSAVLTGDQRQTGIVVVAIGLTGYAAYIFTSAARDRVRNRRKEDARA